MSHHLYRQYAPTVVNDGTSQDEMPLWHGGEGRSYHANPLFPMYNAPVRTPSGDGQGRRVSGAPRVSGDGSGTRGVSGDGLGTRGVSGDGLVTRSVSGDGLGTRSVSGDGLGTRSVSGDGQGGRAQDVVLNVNPLPSPSRKGLFNWLPFGRSKASARGTASHSSQGPKTGVGPTTGVGPADEKGTQRTDTWKLVALVFVFFIWIGTASTLLFLYMDQYLFP